MSAAIVLLGLGPGFTACNGVVAPSPVNSPPPQQPSVIRVFTDEASGYASSDLHDAQDQIVRFTTAGELIWVADGRRFSGYVVKGIQISGPGRNDGFQVRFGTKNRERRLYLGWSDEWCHCPGYTPSVIDVEIVDGKVVFIATELPVPGS
jgi:hypothetical protein